MDTEKLHLALQKLETEKKEMQEQIERQEKIIEELKGQKIEFERYTEMEAKLTNSPKGLDNLVTEGCQTEIISRLIQNYGVEESYTSNMVKPLELPKPWSRQAAQKLMYYIFDNKRGNSGFDLKQMMEKATKKWEEVCNVQFKYCHSDENPVSFVVYVVNANPTRHAFARAAFPADDNRSLKIFPSFETLNCQAQLWVLVHEVGHLLGFTHSNTEVKNNEFKVKLCPDEERVAVMQEIASKDLEKNPRQIVASEVLQAQLLYGPPLKQTNTLPLPQDAVAMTGTYQKFSFVEKTYVMKYKIEGAPSKEKLEALNHVMNEISNICGLIFEKVDNNVCDCFIGESENVDINLNTEEDILRPFLCFLGVKSTDLNLTQRDKNTLRVLFGPPKSFEKVDEKIFRLPKDLIQITDLIYVTTIIQSYYKMLDRLQATDYYDFNVYRNLRTWISKLQFDYRSYQNEISQYLLTQLPAHLKDLSTLMEKTKQMSVHFCYPYLVKTAKSQPKEKWKPLAWEEISTVVSRIVDEVHYKQTPHFAIGGICPEPVMFCLGWNVAFKIPHAKIDHFHQYWNEDMLSDPSQKRKRKTREEKIWFLQIWSFNREEKTPSRSSPLFSSTIVDTNPTQIDKVLLYFSPSSKKEFAFDTVQKEHGITVVEKCCYINNRIIQTSEAQQASKELEAFICAAISKYPSAKFWIANALPNPLAYELGYLWAKNILIWKTVPTLLFYSRYKEHKCFLNLEGVSNFLKDMRSKSLQE